MLMVAWPQIHRRGYRWLQAGIVLATVLFLPGLSGGEAQAHGTSIEAVSVEAIEVTARFDSGEPMAGAQVAVYAPDDESEPWQTGLTDSGGRFVFSPDRTQTGRWAVQVRSAGHGDWVYVDVEGGSVTAVADAGAGFSPAQIVVMSAAVVWGFVGTALYFKSSRSSVEVSDDRDVASNAQ